MKLNLSLHFSTEIATANDVAIENDVMDTVTRVFHNLICQFLKSDEPHFECRILIYMIKVFDFQNNGEKIPMRR